VTNPLSRLMQSSLALLLGACATSAPLPLTAEIQFGPAQLPPQGFHERCLALTPAMRLEYEFSADPPLLFVIEYRQSDMALQPLRKEATRGEAGWFRPDARRDYCLRWENETIYPALLRYRLAPQR